MKKIVSLTLITTLTVSTFAASIVEAKSDYKIKSGKLVSVETGKVVKGFKTYKGVLYKNGKKFSGIQNKKAYKNGKKLTGTYGGLRYENGNLFTGIYKKLKYKKGYLYTGISNGIKYVKGKEEMYKVEWNLFYNPKTETYHLEDGSLVTDTYVSVDGLTEYAYFFTNEGKLDSKWPVDEYAKYMNFDEGLSQFTVYNVFGSVEELSRWNNSERAHYKQLIESLPDGRVKNQVREKFKEIDKKFEEQVFLKQDEMKIAVASYLDKENHNDWLLGYEIQQSQLLLSLIKDENFVLEYGQKLEKLIQTTSLN